MIIKFKVFLNNLSRIYILTLSFLLCLGVFSTAIFGRLPYLYELSFLQRFYYWAVAWLLGAVIFTLTATKSQMQYYIFKRKFEYVKLLGGIFIVVPIAAAYVSSDIIGYLVKILPSNPYEQTFQVISTKTQGSKYKYPSLSIDLKAENNDGFYNLVLAKARFNYTKGQFKANDEIILRGKQNFFGVIVESIQIKNQPV